MLFCKQYFCCQKVIISLLTLPTALFIITVDMKFYLTTGQSNR